MSVQATDAPARSMQERPMVTLDMPGGPLVVVFNTDNALTVSNARRTEGRGLEPYRLRGVGYTIDAAVRGGATRTFTVDPVGPRTVQDSQAGHEISVYRSEEGTPVKRNVYEPLVGIVNQAISRAIAENPGILDRAAAIEANNRIVRNQQIIDSNLSQNALLARENAALEDRERLMLSAASAPR